MRIYRLLAATALVVGTAAVSIASPAQNKQAAIAAMTDLFSHQDPSAVDRYFTSPYRQHNTHIPDGLDALKGLAQMTTTWPGVHTTIDRALADGDLVVLQSEYTNLLNRHEVAVAFDLFRFSADGKIVEHWDALEPLAASGTAQHTQTDGPTEVRERHATNTNRAVVLRYIDHVKIAGNAQDTSQFLATAHYVEHQPPQPVMYDNTEEDLAGRMSLVIADLRYIARHKSVAEGNFVLVQSEGRLAGDTVVEIYDLFRLEGGKILEHWAVHQPVPPAAKWQQSNGPF